MLSRPLQGPPRNRLRYHAVPARVGFTLCLLLACASTIPDLHAGTRADKKEIEQLVTEGKYNLAREKLHLLQERRTKKDFSEVRISIDRAERQSFLKKYYATSQFDIRERLAILDKALTIRLPDSEDQDRLLDADRKKLTASEVELKTQIATVIKDVRARRYSDAQVVMAKLTPYCEYYPEDIARIGATIEASGEKSFEALAVEMACPGSMTDSSNKKEVAALISRTEDHIADSPFLILLNRIGDHFGVTTIKPAARLLISSGAASGTQEALYSKLENVLKDRGYTVSEKATSQDALLVLVSFSSPTVNVQRGKFKKVQSTYVAGTRTVPNPAYQQAEIIYDQANRDVNRIIAASQTNPYAGFAMPRARKNLQQAAQLLASTPQYIEEQIRKDYSFTEFEERYQYQGKWKVTIVLPKYGMEFSNRGTTRKSLTRMGQKGMHEGDVWAVRYGGPNKEEDVIHEGMTESVATIAEFIMTPFVWQLVGNKSIGNQATVAKKLLARMYKVTSPFPVTKTLQDVTALKSLPQSRREKVISAALAEFSPSLKPITVAAGNKGANSSVQNTVGSIYERVLPSVVTIMTESGHGSGFFVTENTVVTNFHVVSGENVVRILLQDKREILGRVKNFDPNLDLALIEVLAEQGPRALPLSAAPPSVGEHVLAIGAPLLVELEGTLTDGLVSALRNTENGVLIQTNAALNPGNSGGPLLNMRGEVVGINTLKLVKEGVEGLGFAVSAEEVKRLLGSEATKLGSTKRNPTEHATATKGLKECEDYYKKIYPNMLPEHLSVLVQSCVRQPDHAAHNQ